MAWDEGKFFDNLNREKNRPQENPHLTEIERETYLAAFAELQMYLLNTSGPPNGSTSPELVPVETGASIAPPATCRTGGHRRNKVWSVRTDSGRFGMRSHRCRRSSGRRS